MTRIDEIGDGIYRIHTPVHEIPGGFSFNQILVVDDEPLLFHTGQRGLFPAVSEAVARVIPVDKLAWIGFSHVEADECGALDGWLAAAPLATPLTGRIGAQIALADSASKPARGLIEGEVLATGKRRFSWLDAPHMPHGWECGYLFEATTATLLCGDLFTQPGANTPPVVETDILGPSEAFRHAVDYYSYTRNARPLLAKLAATSPRMLACMHGSAWVGDGGKLLSALADALAI